MRPRPSSDAVRVETPRTYDGIGEALRAAFDCRRQPDGPLSDALNRLDEIE